VPATVEAVIIFAVLIAPGYLLNQGIAQGRDVDAGRPDLHVLARALVASVIWLLLTWWWASEKVIRWVGEDKVDQHSVPADTWRAVVLVLLPYAVGRLLGSVVQRNWRGADLLRNLGIASTRGTPWDFAWQRVKDDREPTLVIITLEDGRKVAGQFANGSRATVSPQEPEVYLEQAYELKEGGGEQLVVYDRGMHVDGSRIAAIAFKGIPGQTEG
jgi:Family of unknown function (DUF6338)